MAGRRSRMAEWSLPLFGLLAGLLILELYARVFPWTPPTQIVRNHELHELNGVPVWGNETRTNRDCADRHPERQRVLFFGSSITWGSGVEAEETFTAGLQARLDASQPDPGICILNFSQEAFQLRQKAAVAAVEIARYRPALVLWESWSEWREFRIMGDAAFSVSDFHVRPDGFIGIEGVPDTINRELFLRSRLYQYAVLRWGQPSADVSPEHETISRLTPALQRVIDMVRTAGGRFFVYFAPPLDRPFQESAETPTHGREVWESFLRAAGVPNVALARELAEHDHLRLRDDPCCHFNAEGHRALVDVMARVVLEQLDVPASGAANPPS